MPRWKGHSAPVLQGKAKNQSVDYQMNEYLGSGLVLCAKLLQPSTGRTADFPQSSQGGLTSRKTGHGLRPPMKALGRHQPVAVDAVVGEVVDVDRLVDADADLDHGLVVGGDIDQQDLLFARGVLRFR